MKQTVELPMKKMISNTINTFHLLKKVEQNMNMVR